MSIFPICESALLTKSPELSAGSMQIVHSRMGDFQPKMQALEELYVKAMAPTK